MSVTTHYEVTGWHSELVLTHKQVILDLYQYENYNSQLYQGKLGTPTVAHLFNTSFLLEDTPGLMSYI